MNIEHRTSNIEHRTQRPNRALLLRLRCSLFAVRCSLFSLFLLLCGPAFAQEDAELPPPPKRPGVQIVFTPPELKGTLSVGIYSKSGKLVRTLHREARLKDFVVGLNGLITWWDGKTDAGAGAPPGSYSVRGYAVGAVEFQGEAFHFNDWIDDEKSPRIRRIKGISPFGGSNQANESVFVTLANGREGALRLREGGGFEEFPATENSEKERTQREADEVTDVFTMDKQDYGLRGGQVVKKEADGWKKVDIQPVSNAVCFLPMVENNQVGWWIIDRTEEGAEIKRFAPDGAFVRSLVIPQKEPQPFGLCAGIDDAFIILLEESPGLQRVRKLERRAGEVSADADPDAPKASEWAVTMSKTIRSCDKLEDVQADLKTEAGEAFAAVEKITVRLLPNQLVRNVTTKVDVGVGFDAKGSFLRTADGLPLKRITETPGLKWVALMKETAGKGVTIFQSDGAVVEEFKARKLASMMAFDAGEYEWAGK